VTRLALALIPLLLGFLLAFAWQRGVASNPVVYLRSDVGSLFVLLGLGGAAVVAAMAAVRERHTRAVAAATASLEAEEADSRRRFIRRLDHEVKNPLTAMRAALANLNGACDPQTMRSLRGQVDRLARLSADLRKLTDLEIQPLEDDEVDLAGLLAELVEIAHDRPEAFNRSIILTVPQAPWPLAPVPGDRDLLFLAFHNLVDNALKFTTAGATVEIRAYEDGPNVAVEVADTGPGVPADELPHLGEELYRGSAGIGVEGSGLGLALVKAIVTRHNGSVTIRSRPGRGTVVTVRLPGAR
jgi:two-component system, OmpR family, sensor kinase